MDDDDISSNPTDTPAFADILAERLSRRGFLAAASIWAAAGGVAMATSPLAISDALANGPTTLGFLEIKHGNDERLHVPEGYDAEVLIRWGDKVLPDAPAFDPLNQTAAAQAKQFGYNNDFIGYFPLPFGTRNSDGGLLAINHEYTIPYLMFPGLDERSYAAKLTPAQIDIELAAHGMSVIEIRKNRNGRWSIVENSPFARRISLSETVMRMSGPAAGHDRLKTKADPTGTRVIGTMNNCAGGKTPWGTVLTAEENFNQYFAGDPTKTKEARNYARLGIAGKPTYPWGRAHARFNIDQEPNEPNRFGWIVEIDPYDPLSTPVKRTALGRFKHEGATCVVNTDGRVVLYSGDDERFDYLYRFVTAGKFDPINRDANKDLLDSGTLSVAKFNADGTLTWLPLVFGAHWLTPENGFNSQADILIETRRAADLLGATPMDRPEDVETNPVNGGVYMALTNNTSRKQDRLDTANPRAGNKHGHIVEMLPPGFGKEADHTAATYKWNILLLAGNPAADADQARYNEGVSADGWLSCPDNVAFDSKGRLWIATDGAPSAAKVADGIYACDVAGSGRALTRHFLRVPRGAEMCGPEFTPDDRTFFVAVQHPAEEAGSSFDTPSTRWPDFKPNMPPRPSVVAVTKRGGGVVGS
jgi:secreted PhoX family phosphatase